MRAWWVSLIGIWCWASAAASGPDATWSGSWFDPAKNFQGFVVQVLGDDRGVVTWFTYDRAGNPIWMQGVAPFNGNQLVIEELLRYEGGQFDGSHSEHDIQVADGGSLIMTFHGCDGAEAEYVAGPGLVDDAFDLVRLTSLAGFECGRSEQASLDGSLHPGISGGWFVPEIANMGWKVELLPDGRAVVYWFTYDADGAPLWLKGVGQVDGGVIRDIEMTRFSGGRFGPSYSPDDVDLMPWGRVDMAHVGCSSAIVSWTADDDAWGVFDGVVSLLSPGDAAACDFDDGLGALTGQFTGVDGVQMDSTSNDPNAVLVDNSARGSAQPILNPVTVVGIVNAEPMGFGVLAEVADEVDVYRAELQAGQTIRLLVGDWDDAAPGRNDLDLYLFAEGATEPAAVSAGVGRFEYVTVPADGFYDVAVVAESGISAYELRVSFDPIPAGTTAFDLMAEDLPRSILVDHGLARRAAASGLSVHGVEAGVAHEGWVRHRADDTRLTRRGERLSEHYRARLDFKARFKVLALEYGDTAVFPDLTFQVQSSGDPQRWMQWHHDLIQLDGAWAVTRGAGVRVAVLDSGVGPHPDLVEGVRWDLGLDVIAPERHHDPAARVGDDPPSTDRLHNYSHGTHVAGIVAARADNQIGGVGVAPEAEIVPVRVIGSDGSGSLSGIIEGIYWAAGRSEIDGLDDPDRPVDVINMSIGAFGACPGPLQTAIDYARSQGVIVVGSAGNATSTADFLPGSCDGVISVTAVNQDLAPAHYSNCGIHTTLTAPGGQIGDTTLDNQAEQPDGGSGPRYLPGNPLSCRSDPAQAFPPESAVFSTDFRYAGEDREPGMGGLQGTSMAAPHVSGVLALLRAIDPDLDPEAVDVLIAGGALTDRLGRAGWDDEIGHGLIDALRSVATVSGAADVPDTLISRPGFVRFDSFDSVREFTLDALGDPGPFDGFAFDASRFELEAVATGSEGLGTYRLVLDRRGQLPGLYRDELVGESAFGAEIRLPVEWVVPARGDVPDTGYLYAGIFEATTGHLVRLLGGRGLREVYGFSVDGLVPGRYYVATWSDVAWRGGSICAQGNVCGFYPGAGLLQAITVRGGETFNTGTLFAGPGASTGLQGADVSASSSARLSTLRVQPTDLLRAVPAQPVER